MSIPASTFLRCYRNDPAAITTVFWATLTNIRRNRGGDRCFATEEERTTQRIRNTPRWPGPDAQPWSMWRRMREGLVISRGHYREV